MTKMNDEWVCLITDEAMDDFGNLIEDDDE
jgi:hypothetical protein